MRYKFLVFLICSIGAQPSLAQQYSYLHYTVAEGLPSSEVYQCYQDKKGFVWFATDNGVARFDGTEIETFHTRQGLPDPVVFGFHEDLKGRLWFRSYSGRLSWFENETIHSYPYNDTIAALCRKSLLHSMYVDSLDQVWLGAGEFAGCIGRDGKTNIEYTPNHQLYFRTIGSGFITGIYWPSSLVNNIRINDHSFSIDFPEKNYDNQTVNAVRWRGAIYISMANMIFQYDGTTVTRVLKAKDHIISLSVDRENRLWVGFRDTGVTCYRNENFSDPLTLDFLKDKSVTKVLEDDQQGYWITTLQSGAYYIPNFSFRNYALPSGTKIVSAKRMGDRTLLGDDDGRLISMDNKTVSARQTKTLPGRSLLAVFIDSKKNIWASTSRSGYLLDSALTLLNTLMIQHDFFESRDTIYGLSRVRIASYRRNGERITNTPMTTIHRTLLHCPPFVLMSSRTGLDVFDDRIRFLRTLDAFKNCKVSKMLNLNDTAILVTTIGTGYFVIRKGSWEIITRSDGKNFIGDNVYTADVVDSTLWLGTEKGIAITPLPSLLRNAPDFYFLDKQDGLISNKINLLVYAPPSVWAFTDQGFTVLPNHRDLYFAPVPRFYLKEMLVNDRPADLYKQKELPFLSNNIQIDFGFINFKHRHILLRSRLTPNGVWNYSEDRSLKFYSLAPGNYTFQLQYSMDRIHWTNALEIIPFSIEQPWWRTSWFQAIIIGSIILILYFIFGSQMSVLRHRNERLNALNENKKSLLQAEIETLERERSRIAKDLHDGIGMNLTVLKLQLHEFLKKHREPDTSFMEEQLKSTIQEIRSIVHDLTPSGIALFGLAESVKDYIERTTGKLGITIEVISSGKKIVDPKISLFSFRIIQELLSNSLKHSKATVIAIRINGFENTLNIIFQDNGTGFDPALCKYGSGLMNIQTRLEALEGTMEFSSTAGVLYILNIPLSGNILNPLDSITGARLN